MLTYDQVRDFFTSANAAGDGGLYAIECDYDTDTLSIWRVPDERMQDYIKASKSGDHAKVQQEFERNADLRKAITQLNLPLAPDLFESRLESLIDKIEDRTPNKPKWSDAQWAAYGEPAGHYVKDTAERLVARRERKAKAVHDSAVRGRRV